MPIPVNIEGVGKVNFPDDYTPDRIKFAIENDILPRVKAEGPKPEKPSGLVRLGRGFADVTEGLGQAARYVGEKAGIVPEGTTAAYTKERSEEIANYERGRGKDAGIDWLRMGGNVAGTAPAMLIPGGAAASLGGRVAAGAAQGAVASGALFTPEGESKAGQVATGLLFGGAVPVAVQGAKRAGGALLDRIRPNVSVTVNPQQAQALTGEITLKLQQQGVDFGRLTADVQKSLVDDAQRALTAGGTLDDAMLANKALIESVGAKSTRASVTRNPKDWQTEKNLRGITGVGEPIAARESENAASMVDYLSRLRGQTGGKAGTPLEAGESAVKAIQAQDAAKETVVDKLYEAYRASGAQDAHVPDTKIAEALGKVSDEIGTENIPSAVLSRMKEFGFLGGTRTKLMTVNEADKLNRLINNNNPGHGPQSLALGRLKSALNESLLDIPVESGGAKAGVQNLSTREMNPAMSHLRIADENLAKGKGSVTPNAPVDVEYNTSTGKYQLVDGYHRYLAARGGSIANALEQAKQGIFPDMSANVKLVKSEASGGFERTVPVEGAADSLLKARAAAAQRFAEQRAGKGITAAVDDVSPDRFVKRFVYDADVRDVKAMWGELGKSPQGTQAKADVKGHLLDNLLMKATRATNVDDVAGKPFSGVVFGKALDAIPPEKLHILFTPTELESLRTLQRASKLLTEEVPFSDVNHSKTAAALSNLLLKVGQTPLIGKLLSPIIGTGKIGMDWVKSAGERKQVAEILLGKAGNAPVKGPLRLPPPNDLERVLPGALAGAGAGTND